MFRLLTLAFSVLLSTVLFAQTTLTPGDIAVIAHNNDNPDQFAFVALVPIAQGTVIRFTDNAWNGSALATSEGTLTYTAPSALAAGSRVILGTSSPGVSVSGTFELNTSGDQIIVYQGTASSPAFIYAFSSRAWVTGSVSGTTSRIPAGLVNGTTARDFSSEVDNGFYNVTSTSGDKAFILSQIGMVSKWSRSNSRYSSFPAWTFTLASASNEPSAQPQNVSFSNVSTYRLNVAWTAPSPSPEGYLVLRSASANPSGQPADGVTYAVGDAIGSFKVAYAGNATSFVQRGIMGGTTYTYHLFAYNGTGSARNYRQTAPAVAVVTTPATMEGNYYSGVDPISATFVSDLQNRVRNPYTRVSYALYDETIVTEFSFRDTTGGQRVAWCVYSGQKVNYTMPFAWTPTTPFSREHTWCHSWMPSSASTSTNEYADQHHLFVVNQNNANAVRSNHPLGEVVNPVSTYLQGMYGFDASGNLVYEPREAQKRQRRTCTAVYESALQRHQRNGLVI
jgi:hypothetical protein